MQAAMERLLSDPHTAPELCEDLRRSRAEAHAYPTAEGWARLRLLLSTTNFARLAVADFDRTREQPLIQEREQGTEKT